MLCRSWKRWLDLVPRYLLLALLNLVLILDVHIVQVQQNADNSATFRVTDTQNSIGAVQEAVPAPGTQQYRLTSWLCHVEQELVEQDGR